METIGQLVTVGVAILIVSSYLAYGAKRHVACVAIIQVVLFEIRSLIQTDLWKISRNTVHFGASPRLLVILNSEDSEASISFVVDKKYTYFQLFDLRNIGDKWYKFSLSCPAQYFDVKFLSRAIQRYEGWTQGEPSNLEEFYFPPTGQLLSTDVDGNMSVPSDPCYAEIRRVAKRSVTARYPILEY